MLCRHLLTYSLVLLGLFAWFTTSRAQAQSSSSSSSSAKHGRKASDPELDAGSVSGSIYRNKTLGLVCTIPPGWVLRAEEMKSEDAETSRERTQRSAENGSEGKVLLAVFSRPPEAKGAEINSSILIAAEPVTAYPGLTDAAQYFEPLTGVAKAQGFSVDEEPYEFSIEGKTLVRSDFHKDIGSRVMRQSTVTFLAHNYVVSVTVIGGTEEEVEDLLSGLEFPGSPHAKPR